MSATIHEQEFGRKTPKFSGPEYCFHKIARTDRFLAVLSDLGLGAERVYFSRSNHSWVCVGVKLMDELKIFTLSMTLYPHPSYLSHWGFFLSVFFHSFLR